ncbi:MAG: ECF transporter S component [Erysipelothrix sp.]|nr:ECF transporter S component [Erysipelothrix sp.]
MRRTSDLAKMALMAALCFIAFNYFKIDISVMGDRTSFHFANSFVVLGALLLGGFKGGLAGAVGLTLADFTTGYAHVAPRTFFLKLMIGLIAGLVAHQLGKINDKKKTADILKWSVLAGLAGMSFNVIFDPLVGYLFNIYILGVEANPATIIATWSAGVTAINGVITVIVSTLVYMALRRMKFKI